MVKRKSAKACVFPNFAPAGIFGPNGGTSFERLTATLGTERCIQTVTNHTCILTKVQCIVGQYLSHVTVCGLI